MVVFCIFSSCVKFCCPQLVRLLVAFSKVSVEPLDHRANVVRWVRPGGYGSTVAPAGHLDEIHLDTDLFELAVHDDRMFERDGPIIVAVHQEERRVIGGYVCVDRRFAI